MCAKGDTGFATYCIPCTDGSHDQHHAKCLKGSKRLSRKDFLDLNIENTLFFFEE